MIKKLQKKYALSEQGAKDLIKGCLACVLQNLSFMFPVGLLFCHLQRKRHPPHYSGRASTQNPPFLFREKGFSRSYQYHYGGLHLPGAEFFAFYP